MIKKYSFISIILVLTTVACSSQNKDEPKTKLPSGNIEIMQSWARPAAERANSAVYLSIYNGTTQPDTLLGIQSELFGKAEVHESYTTDEGLSGMRPAGKLAVASGDSIILKPGGLHVMLVNASKDVTKGDSLQLLLEFAYAGLKTISVPVR